MEYNFSEIEKQWKKYWADAQVYKVENDTTKPKYYVLDMFPYPSGAGLHVGHPLGYIASDIFARYKRLCGYNVLHPMGFDDFGLPAEQYAIETGQHPAITTEKNIARYREQLDNIGFCYDWDREVRTSDPEFYKWTQWIFLQLFHSWYNRKLNTTCPIAELLAIFEEEGNINHPCPGDENWQFDEDDWDDCDEKEQREILMKYRLAYQGYAQVWWCEALGTVLANDEVVNGVSERGGHPVERKNMRQWFLRITEYADRLLQSLDILDWSEPMKEMQRNWIGKSTGATITYAGYQGKPGITVFTTRPDTIFGVDFLVLAPEHDAVQSIATNECQNAVNEYIQYVKGRSERERQAEVKQVTGCFTGGYAIHPLTNRPIPIWISEYVLVGYGTGAIMGVPSGDERDHRFAKHFNIPITNIFGEKYTGEDAYSEKSGTVENSGFLSGLNVPDAIEAAISALEKLEAGKRRVNFRLRDAGFSRQRYWGEPFPIIYIDGVPYGTDEAPISNNHELSQLPVVLPKVDNYKPGPEGQGPLANLPEWVKVNLSSPPAPLHKWRGEQDSDATASGENDLSSLLAPHHEWRGEQDSDATASGENDFSSPPAPLHERRGEQTAEANAPGENDAKVVRNSYIPKYAIKIKSPFETARQNRKQSTDAENILWQHIRAEKTGVKFRRQHPIDAYIADFVCLQKALIVEVDGDYHNDPVQQKLDNERTKTLEDIGFKVIRFTNEQVKNEIKIVVENIKKELFNLPTLLQSRDAEQQVTPSQSLNSEQNGDTKHVTPSPLVERGPGGEESHATPSRDVEQHVTPSPLVEKGPGVEAYRETNTMPGYAGSSWYFLRYMDPHNKTEFASRKAIDYWQQVDLYAGGSEHAVGHLLYSRMWTKALYDLGHIGFDEPFKKLVNQGMIQGSSRFVFEVIINNIIGSKMGRIFVSKSHFEKLKKIENHIEQVVEYLNSIGVDMFEAKSIRPDSTVRIFRLHIDVKLVNGIELIIPDFKMQFGINEESGFLIAESDGTYICDSEVEKMSKSKYNVVNPDDIVTQYGADTFRMYEMFLGPVEMSKPWDTKGIEGVHRFLKKMWRLYCDEQRGWIVTEEAATDAELRILHKTIKKITEDIERYAFNTSVSQFMITVNELSTLSCHKRAILEPLAILICPFAPHIAEELWQNCFHRKTSIVAADFPKFEQKYVTDNSKVYPVAINGKPRYEMEFPLDALQEDIEKEVLNNETILKWTEGKPPKKFIYVKGKMINVVL